MLIVIEKFGPDMIIPLDKHNIGLNCGKKLCQIQHYICNILLHSMHILTHYIRLVIHFPGKYMHDRKAKIWPISWA